MEKSCTECAQKASPRLLFNFAIDLKEEIVLKIRYFVRVLSKTLKKVNFVFSFKPRPF